jgi:hypothetical protein
LKPTPASRAARQEKLRKTRLEQGIKPVKVWVSNTDMERLKERYPGPRNGVNWQAVIDAAMKGEP